MARRSLSDKSQPSGMMEWSAFASCGQPLQRSVRRFRRPRMFCRALCQGIFQVACRLSCLGSLCNCRGCAACRSCLKIDPGTSARISLQIRLRPVGALPKPLARRLPKSEHGGVSACPKLVRVPEFAPIAMKAIPSHPRPGSISDARGFLRPRTHSVYMPARADAVGRVNGRGA